MTAALLFPFLISIGGHQSFLRSCRSNQDAINVEDVEMQARCKTLRDTEICVCVTPSTAFDPSCCHGHGDWESYSSYSSRPVTYAACQRIFFVYRQPNHSSAFQNANRKDDASHRPSEDLAVTDLAQPHPF